MDVGTWYPLIEALEFGYRSPKSVIYCIRNTINQKCYVGKTTHPVSLRFRGHVYDAFVNDSGYIIHTALRKHGIETFEVSVLETCEPEKLNEAEIRHIAELGSFGAGYNATRGGDGLQGFVVRPETRELIRSKKKGIPLPNWLKAKLRKAVKQIDEVTGEMVTVYWSLSEAYKETDISISSISMCCHGKLPRAGGFKWEFVNPRDKIRGSWSDDKRHKMSERLKKHDPRCRKVEQINLNTGEVITIYSSIRDARKLTGIVAISAVCRGTRNHAGGFFWRYVV